MAWFRVMTPMMNVCVDLESAHARTCSWSQKTLMKPTRRRRRRRRRREVVGGMISLL